MNILGVSSLASRNHTLQNENNSRVWFFEVWSSNHGIFVSNGYLGNSFYFFPFSSCLPLIIFNHWRIVIKILKLPRFFFNPILDVGWGWMVVGWGWSILPTPPVIFNSSETKKAFSPKFCHFSSILLHWYSNFTWILTLGVTFKWHMSLSRDCSVTSLLANW